jgi:hypothetical protein
MGLAVVWGVAASPVFASWNVTSSAATAAAKANALVAPGAGSTSGATSSSIQVNWTAAATGAPATGYQVFRGGTLIAAGGCASTTTTATAAVFCTDNNGLAASTTYTYTVKAVRATNWVGPANTGFDGTTTSAGPASVTVSTLTLANNNNALAEDDSITIDFSVAVRPSSICSSFSDSASGVQTVGDGGGTNGAFTARIKDHAATPVTTNDQLTLLVSSAGCGGTVNFGTLDLGSNAWTTATRTYQGNGSNSTSLTLNAAHTQLVVAIGSGTTTGAVSSATSTFTPSGSIKDDATNTVGASGSKTTTTRF